MIKPYSIEVNQYGSAAILVQWESKIDPALNLQVRLLAHALKEDTNIQEIVSGYASLLILYNKQIRNIHNQEKIIREIYAQSLVGFSTDEEMDYLEIPVCYNKRFGIDIEIILNNTGLDHEGLISAHTAPTYQVYMLGFLPGFAFLGGMDPMLTTPRKDVPRQQVDRGSVAIGGEQTGIYPMASPGGWNIIGRSPIKFFEMNFDPPSIMNPGDKVVFKAIDIDTFFQIREEVDHNTFDYQKLLKEWKS